jgi:hypothetical protein
MVFKSFPHTAQGRMWNNGELALHPPARGEKVTLLFRNQQDSEEKRKNL